VEIEPLGYQERQQILKKELGEHSERLQPAIEECARRFRFEEMTLERITHGLKPVPQLSPEELLAAFRWEADGQLGDLAQRVHPRFRPEELVLSQSRTQQYHEVLKAMQSLTEVHYKWGTAKDWNEGGMAVLFCGPPGTGKTMAAEAASVALSMDMYRVDLSQVVNKYIGETEKNLKRIFDAAETSDCILFFDECDALFGKRTDVKDAHDRFANIEISYLLERMERFKGLAILATNRRKDLDEAFMRRLRYILEFPVPEKNERERIWRGGFPEKVDVSELDFHFLAKQFVFSGGHIRSIIFNSCLQAAGEVGRLSQEAGKVGKVTMADVLVQVKRELQKLNRTSGEDQFGRYAELLKELVP
jgi:vesicle-fusing ATPase